MPFMKKVRSAVEHRPVRADEIFREEFCEVPHSFSVDCIDGMHHGTKSSVQERLPLCQQQIMSETCRNTIIAEVSPILPINFINF